MHDPSTKPRENATIVGGENDTSAHLFGNSKCHEPKTSHYESVSKKKETHLLLSRSNADNLNRLKLVEDEIEQALGELENANVLLHELQIKFNNICESKQAAFHTIEEANARAKQLKESFTSSTQFINGDEADVKCKIQEYYMAELSTKEELSSARYELANLHQDIDTTMKAKLYAFQNTTDAKHSAGVNRNKMMILSKEIGSKRSTLSQVKIASSQAQEGHSKNMADKDVRLHAKRIAKEGVLKRIRCFEDEYCDVDPQVLQEMLEETNESILVLQDQLNTVRTSDLEYLQILTSEVDDAKEKLCNISKEKDLLMSSLKLLKLDLQKVRMDNKELKEKVRETSLLSHKLQVELVTNKEEHETTLDDENKQVASVDSARSRLQDLSFEVAHARTELDQVNRNIEALKHEAKNFKAVAKLGDEKLMFDEIRKEDLDVKLLRQSSIGCSYNKIRITIEEFESLKRREKMRDAQREVEKAKAKVEEVNGREKEAMEKVDEISKEIKDIKETIRHSLNQARMVEAAKHAVETELLRKRMLANSHNGH